MPEGITLKRIIDMDEAAELSSSDYALVDSATGGPKKFALGEELSSLKEELGEHNSILSDEFGYLFPTWEHGNISSQGEVSTDLVARTNYIPFVTGQKLKVVFPDYFTSVRVLLYKEATYDNNSYIALANLVSGQEYQLNNTGLQYIRFRAVANDAVVDLLRTFEIIPQIQSDGNTSSKINEMSDVLNTAKNNAASASTVLTNDFGYLFPLWEHGNITSAGESNTNTIVRTNYVPVAVGDKIKITYPQYFSTVYVFRYKQASYADNSYIGQQQVASGDTLELTGTGLNYIRFKATAGGSVIDLNYTNQIDIEFTEKGIQAGIRENTEDIEMVANDFIPVDLTVSTDLIQGFVETRDGTFNDSLATYKRTGFVRIPTGTTRIVHTFPFSVSGTDGWAVYDKNKIYITGGRTSQIEVKENYAFFAISCRLSAVVDDKVTLTFLDAKLNNCNYNIVMLGDSIIGNYDGDDSVPAFLNAYSKANCYNCAFGGSTMGADLDNPHQYIEAFNGYKIVNAIVSNDYSEQLQAIADDPTYTELRANFSAHVSTLQNMDWSTVDVVTFAYGTNDWGTRVILSDETDDHSTDTFAGAFRTAIETLLTAYPHIKIAVCAPIWRGIVTTSGVLDDDTDTSKATRQWYLNEYREKAKEIADEYHALYIDAYQGLNFNKFTWKQYFPLNDATHPNATGRQAIAKKYAYCLASI